MEELKCPICGEPTSVYMGNARKDRLCRNHAKDFKDGIIEQCPDCGKWHNTGETCICKQGKDEKFENVCIVCGKPTKGKPQCKDCYNETKEYIDGLDKNAGITEHRNYYYNLKDYIFRMGNMNGIMTNCNKLIAIALNNANCNDDSSLSDRVYKDVQYTIEKKQAFFEEQSKKREELASSKQAEIKPKEEKENIVYLKYSEDGHALDSEMEIRIDDTLYSSEIFHSCHKPITEILSKNKTSDWFIPIEGINKGIYIEYWGMDTPKYVADKEEKIRLYKEYDIPFIEIQKDEPKNNSQLFKANLIREITKKAEEYFGKMPKWKK